MAAVAGYGGNATEVKSIGDWSLDVSRDMLETTSMNDGEGGWRTYIPGLAGATGSMNIRFDSADAGQIALRAAHLAGTSITLELYEDATHKYSGTAYLTGLSPKAAVEGLVEQSASFQFSGEVAYP